MQTYRPALSSLLLLLLLRALRPPLREPITITITATTAVRLLLLLLLLPAVAVAVAAAAAKLAPTARSSANGTQGGAVGVGSSFRYLFSVSLYASTVRPKT